MSDSDLAPIDPVIGEQHPEATDVTGSDVAARAAHRADDLYVDAERRRRQESLDSLLTRDSKA